MTEWSRGGTDSEPEISGAIRWMRRQRVRARGNGLRKSGMDSIGTVPCTDVGFYGVWVGIGGLGLASVLVYYYVSAFKR